MENLPKIALYINFEDQGMVLGYGCGSPSMTNIRGILSKFCPEISREELNNFIFIFYPFMFGIYPYTRVTEKQKTAMKDAQVDFVEHSIYEITYNCLIRLLGQ